MAHFRRRMPYSLGSDMLPDEPGPLKEKLEPEKEVKLSRDIKELYQKLLPSPESEERRVKFVRKLEKLLDTQWPGNEIKVNVFGSSGNKLCTSDSDGTLLSILFICRYQTDLLDSRYLHNDTVEMLRTSLRSSRLFGEE